MGNGKWLSKKEVIKALKKWIENHKPDSSYNLTIGKNFTLSQKGSGMTDSQFEILVGKIDGIDKKVDGIDKRLVTVEKRLTNIVEKNNLKE